MATNRAEPQISAEMERLSTYISGALAMPLPDDIVAAAKLHILDTFAAMITGARLHPGAVATAYAGAIPGEATILGTALTAPAIDAALANGMSAHADETDDSHAPALLHPGCIVVPAALAAAEKWGGSGRDLIRATALGYDVVVRFSLALGALKLHNAGHAITSTAGVFGAGAAAAALARLDPRQVRHAISYCGQQSSGLSSWRRDPDHVEKAFVFGGMPARNGVASAAMVSAGMTGVEDVLAGPTTYLGTFSVIDGTPAMLVEGLGEVFEIGRTNIKKWCVGSPIQAPLDSVQALMADHGLTAAQVARMRIHVPTLATTIIDNTTMSDLDVRYLLSVLLLDGDLSFEAAHDDSRLSDPSIQALRARMDVIGSDELEALRPERQAIVEVDLTDGRSLRHHTLAVRGTQKNRMTAAEIEAKARGLLAPVLGDDGAEALIARVATLDDLDDVRALRPFIAAG